MFQLIVAVISIALVAALAIASIFYGGDAFTKSSERANVTALINQAQQIAGANALYKTDTGNDAPNVATLATETNGIQYLAQVPNGSKITTGDWAFDGDDIVIAFADANACDGDIGTYIAAEGAGECDTGYFRFAR